MTNSDLAQLPVLALPGTSPDNLTGLNPLQSWLYDYVPVIQVFWWVIFALVAGYLAWRLGQAWREARAVQVPARAMPDTARPDDGRWQTRLTAWYRRFFYIHEIEECLTLRLLGGVILLGFISSFLLWIKEPSTSIGNIPTHFITEGACWPFFQGCEALKFMTLTPYGYTQPIIYMGLTALIFLGAWALLVKRIVLAHAIIMVLFFWSVYVILISYAYDFAATYTYYLISATFVFLFCAQKRFFACVSFVLFYYLSTTSKITDTWILGNYFTSLQSGMAIFPDAIAPVITNIVIGMEMVGAWFLLSSKKSIRIPVLVFFGFFHLYSGLYVFLHYPLRSFSLLLVLFGPLFRPFDKIPMGGPASRGWIYLAVLCLLQSIPLAIPGDSRLTMEGNFYGLFMFEANHQCSVMVSARHGGGGYQHQDANSHHRCDPYKAMVIAQRMHCSAQNRQFGPYAFRILHSINGGPFYEIVNEPDLCRLEYKAFQKNDWIKTQDTAPAVYRPAKNFNR